MRRIAIALLVLGTASSCKRDGDSTKGHKPTEAAPAKAGGKSPGGSLTGFDPVVHGFKFQNYGNEKRYTNLTPAELRRMFGDGVCASTKKGACLLTPPAAAWMREQNAGMGGGHCEGMAVTSMLMHMGKLSPKDFGADTVYGLELEGNTKLQREIAYWFVSQATAPVTTDAITGLTPKELVAKLREAWAKGKAPLTLGFYQPDHTGGHATTAYGLEDKGKGLVWILHYDNNYPGEEKHIEVDTEKDTWKYFTAADPNEPGEEYSGDAETKTLEAVASATRLEPMTCPFCGDVEDEVPPTKGHRQIFVDGKAELLVRDDAGHKIGHEDGKLVKDYPGAALVVVRSNQKDHEPVFDVPTGKPLTVTIDGSHLAKESDTDVVLLGHGYDLAVEGIKLDPGQKDTLMFSADGHRITYETKGEETPTLTLGITTKAADYLLRVQVTGDPGGQRVELEVDLAHGVFVLGVHGKAGKATYTVELHRIDDDGEQVFTHKGLSIGKDALTLDYLRWKGEHNGLAIGVDKDHDGHPDGATETSDED